MDGNKSSVSTLWKAGLPEGAFFQRSSPIGWKSLGLVQTPCCSGSQTGTVHTLICLRARPPCLWRWSTDLLCPHCNNLMPLYPYPLGVWGGGGASFSSCRSSARTHVNHFLSWLMWSSAGLEAKCTYTCSSSPLSSAEAEHPTVVTVSRPSLK